MQTNRRRFLKISGLAGMSLEGIKLTGCSDQQGTKNPFTYKHTQRFNMSGYAAPRLETVRIGLIGTGSRGTFALRRWPRIEGVKITALCDIVPEKIDRAMDILKDYPHNPATYSESEDDWKKVCERDDVDLVYICTPWHMHGFQSVYAMEHGKHVATELPAAQTIEECWKLVETSERTKKHCMLLGNVCYGFFELLVLNMARQGFFGEIIHGEGAYIHELMWLKFRKDKVWRLEENSTRDGNLYPMHGHGPIAQVMDINYGDQMDYLTSVSSNDFVNRKMAEELAAEDDFWKPYLIDRNYCGNINTSIIRTHKGRTIMLQYDISSPRPYSRIHLISGTKGIARQYPEPPRIATDHSGWLSEEEFKKLEKQYTPEITKRVGDMARGEIGGHGGMDTMMDWRLIDCLRNGIPLDMDVYDAAAWSSIIPLTEWSVANRSMPVDIPDFTCGAWKTNKPLMDIMLENGGNTKLI